MSQDDVAPERSDVMTARKKVAAWIAITVLVLGCAMILWLSALISMKSFVDDPNSAEPQLHESWVILLWLFDAGPTINSLFATLLVIITAGTAAVAELYKRTAQLVFLACVCLVAMSACAYLLIQIDQPENANILRWFAEYETVEDVHGASVGLIGPLIGWFGVFLIVQLGIRDVKSSETGAVRKVLGALWPKFNRPEG